MNISDKIARLTNIGIPLIGFNESNKELILYGDFRIRKDVDTYIDTIENISTYNIGENFIDFISITNSKLEKVRESASTSFYSSSYNDDIITELDCLYLFLIFNSPNRSSLTLEASTKLEYLAEEFRYALDFCCSTDFDPKLNTLSNLQRYYLYCNIYRDNMNSNNWLDPNTRSVLEPHGVYEELKILPKFLRTEERINDDDYFSPITSKCDIPDNIISWITHLNVSQSIYYECISLEECIKVEFMKIVNLNIKVKKCKDCGKHYVLKGDYSTDYCDRIQPGAKFTCKKLAAMRARKEKVNNSPILKEYEKAYKRNYAKCINKRWTQKQFRLWADDATIKRAVAAEQYKTEPDKTLNDFKEYLNNK